MVRSLLQVHNELNLGGIRDGTDKESPKKLFSNIYDPLIGHLKSKPVKMLEIGVRGGGSTRLWLSYFENIHLFTLDNGDDLTKEIVDEIPDMNKLTFIKADAYLESTLSQIPNELDVIIDDGPHTLKSQVYFLHNYINKLKGSGMMFVEDIQATHWIDDLIMAVPRKFRGCIRVVDLRRQTSVGDALVLVVHKHSKKNCEITIEGRNYNSTLSKLCASLRVRKLKYRLNRLFSKIFWKFRSKFI